MIKDVNQRPKFNKLLEHVFIKKSDVESVDVVSYFREIMAAIENNGAFAELYLTMQGPLGTKSLRGFLEAKKNNENL